MSESGKPMTKYRLRQIKREVKANGGIPPDYIWKEVVKTLDSYCDILPRFIYLQSQVDSLRSDNMKLRLQNR